MVTYKTVQIPIISLSIIDTVLIFLVTTGCSMINRTHKSIALINENNIHDISSQVGKTKLSLIV